MATLTGKQCSEYIEGKHAVNPNGVDVGVSEVWRIPFDSTAIIHGKQREVCKERVSPHGDYYILEKGIYEVRLSAKVNIPQDCTAFAYPRSTFNRLGVVKCQTAVFDSGYSGYGTQTIYVPLKKIKVHKDEFWFQLVFFRNEQPAESSYDGHWQGEELASKAQKRTK